MIVENYTPHACVIYKDGEKVLSVEPEAPGKGIRLMERVVRSRQSTIGDLVIEVVEKEYYEAYLPSGEPLPEPDGDTIYIVSKMVCDALPDRRDLYCPDTGEEGVVRDEKGRIIGTKRLQQALVE